MRYILKTVFITIFSMLIVGCGKKMEKKKYLQMVCKRSSYKQLSKTLKGETFKNGEIIFNKNKIYGNFNNLCRCYKNLKILRVTLGDKEIKGLNHCKTITHLVIYGENLEKIDPKELPENLTNLYLSYTKIDNFDNLKTVKKLKNIWIADKNSEKNIDIKKVKKGEITINYINRFLINMGCYNFNLDWQNRMISNRKIKDRYFYENCKKTEFKVPIDKNKPILFNNSTIDDPDCICKLFKLIKKRDLSTLVEINNSSAINYLLKHYKIDLKK